MPENKKNPPDIPSPREESVDEGDPSIRLLVDELLRPITKDHNSLREQVAKLEGTVSHLATHRYVAIAIGSAIVIIFSVISALR
ncbi:MAG: hypothetical protein OXG88_09295 [Gammaproteobacteria bacterium]|nr:hypothetical protein [Gammaproteobacteria bacterium]